MLGVIVSILTHPITRKAAAAAVGVIAAELVGKPKKLPTKRR